MVGVALTGVEVLLVLALQERGMRKLEALIVSLMLVIALCFGVELVLAKPDLVAIDRGANNLLIFSQVMLSLQLPFAVYPLVRLTNDRGLMGSFANRRATVLAAWALTGVLVGLNVVLLVQSI